MTQYDIALFLIKHKGQKFTTEKLEKALNIEKDRITNAVRRLTKGKDFHRKFIRLKYGKTQEIWYEKDEHSH